MRVAIVGTFDTEAVLQDFLQTVRAWEAGRPGVHVNLSVDAPELSLNEALLILRSVEPPLNSLRVVPKEPL